MRCTVLGGCGAWPAAGQACSGYVLEHQGFRVLIDPGYAVLPRLLQRMRADEVDAVLVTHGHPDHCADLNALLRARALADVPAGTLPVHAPPGALDAVLALDNRRMLAGSFSLHELGPGMPIELGPFRLDVFDLPHHVPNARGPYRVAGRGGAAPAHPPVARHSCGTRARGGGPFLRRPAVRRLRRPHPRSPVSRSTTFAKVGGSTVSGISSTHA
ncbi:MBL fold metallo-hydrolase [Nonomuraea turkmeniaca]|uniref:MBL fold metallo-hydrolase n=1 Tax=Nonomuraea turkmeniaca TaxID=103838 RepID=UPI001FE36C31|nr:MBL fold metallo-hydrolase [Nonomuraea turkmeniaca]